ncbi:MAG: putative rane protein [Anaerophaga sp.]|nr:putative rane protein [Anaerophaga sp.]
MSSMNGLKERTTFENSREHLANERTFLAWIRTSIAMMGLGFVIVKFALFLKQISMLLNSDEDYVLNGYSAMVGVIMIIIGVIIAALAFLQYIKTRKQLNQNVYVSSSWLSMFITFIILSGGIVLILYLLSVI